MAIPPGSVFKVLTSIALLQDGKIDPDEKIFCRGYLDKPDKFRCYIYPVFGVGHGDTDLTEALCHSCNVYFFTAARKMGPDPILQWAQRSASDNRPASISPASQAATCQLPRAMEPAAHDRQGRSRPRWLPGDTLGLAIGQSKLTVTPMQIARMMAAVANGGYLVTPHFVRDSGPTMVESGSLGLESANDFRRIPDLMPETICARARCTGKGCHRSAREQRTKPCATKMLPLLEKRGRPKSALAGNRTPGSPASSRPTVRALRLLSCSSIRLRSPHGRPNGPSTGASAARRGRPSPRAYHHARISPRMAICGLSYISPYLVVYR